MSWYEVLVCSGMRSSWVDIGLLLVPKQSPAAAAPISSNLICSCFIATVACIWYIGSLHPTLFGVSCRCNLLVKMKREEKKPSQKKPTSKMLVSQHYFHALQNRTSLVCMSSRASRAAVWIQNFHPSLSRVILQEVYRDSCDMWSLHIYLEYSWIF